MVGIVVGGAFVAGVALGPAAVALAAAVVAIGRAVTGRTNGVLPVLLIVAALGWWRSVEPPSAPVVDWIDDLSTVRGVIVSGPVDAGRWQRFELEPTEALIARRWVAVNGRLCVSGPVLPRVGQGDLVSLNGWARPLEDLPSGFAGVLAAKGCVAEAYGTTLRIERRGTGAKRALDDGRRSAADRLQQAAPGDVGALLAGLVTGNDEALSRARRDAFVRTGTTHITAVSGSNVALLVVVLVAAGGAAGVRHRLAWIGLIVVVVWLYALMVGFQPPQVRAAMVASAALFARGFGRRPDLVTLIVLAAAMELAVKPADIHSVSFQYSYASALALALAFSVYAVDRERAVIHRLVRASVVAQLATVPITAATFGVASVTALPANLLIAPLVYAAVPLAALATTLGFASEALGRLVALPAELLAAAIIWIVETLASPRFAQLRVGSDPVVVGVMAALAIGVIVAISGETRRAIGRWRPRTWLALAAASASRNRLTRNGRER